MFVCYIFQYVDSKSRRVEVKGSPKRPPLNDSIKSNYTIQNPLMRRNLGFVTINNSISCSMSLQISSPCLWNRCKDNRPSGLMFADHSVILSKVCVSSCDPMTRRTGIESRFLTLRQKRRV